MNDTTERERQRLAIAVERHQRQFAGAAGDPHIDERQAPASRWERVRYALRVFWYALTVPRYVFIGFLPDGDLGVRDAYAVMDCGLKEFRRVETIAGIFADRERRRATSKLLGDPTE